MAPQLTSAAEASPKQASNANTAKKQKPHKKGMSAMALEFEKLSPHLKEVLLNLKHMSPMQRFNEVSKPRFELQWQTVAFRYGMEKLERQEWMIPDQEVLNPMGCASRDLDGSTPRNGGASLTMTSGGAANVRGAASTSSPLINTSPVINTDCTDQEQKQDSPQSIQSSTVDNGCASRDPGPSLPASPPAGQQQAIRQSRAMPLVQDDTRSHHANTARDVNNIPQELLNSLYSGDDRGYVERPDIEEERQHSIEMAARIAAGDTQLNGQWQVLRDEEVLQADVRAEIEERGGVEAIPVNDDFVLARDGRVMYRTQLQHALERELRDRMGVPEAWETDQKKILWHKEQLARLEKADAAPRCEHIYSDGTRCQAPKLKTGQWCYAHERMKSVRSKKLELLPTEDANSIMLNLGDIGRALINDEISEKKAGLLMYSQQLGLVALSRVTFKETDGRAMVREAPEVLLQRMRRRKQKKMLPPVNADSTDHSDGPNASLPSANGGSRPATAEQLTPATQNRASTPLGENRAHRGPRTTPQSRPTSVNATAVLPASVRDDASRLVAEERAQAGAPQPRDAQNRDVPRTPLTMPHEHSYAGVECAKSNKFGVEPGGAGESRMEKRSSAFSLLARREERIVPASNVLRLSTVEKRPRRHARGYCLIAIRSGWQSGSCQ